MEDSILDADIEKKEKTGKEFKSAGEVKEFKNMIRVFVQKSLDEGKSKSDIFKEITQEHGNRYEKLISHIISFAIPNEKYDNNKNLIKIATIFQLCSLLLLIPLFYFRFTTTEYSTLGYVFSGVWVAVEISLLRGLIKKRGHIFNSIIIISVIKIFSNLGEFGEYNYNYLIIISVGIALALFLISISVNKKLFGKIYYRGAKKISLGIGVLM